MRSFVILILVLNVLGVLSSVIHLSVGKYPRFTRVTSFADAMVLVANTLVVVWSVTLLMP